MNEVQTLIDGLAARLQRPVGVDDRRFRAVAYSSHVDEIDAVRRASILGRQAPEAVTRWLEELGVPRIRGFLRVPANPELGMVARVCFPLRFHERLLGFLWLVEPDGPLDEQELEACQRWADDLAQELFRRNQQTDLERRLEAECVERLVDPDGRRTDAESARIAAQPFYAVLAVGAMFQAGYSLPAGIDVRLTEAIDRHRRAIEPRHQLADVGETAATVVIAAATPAAVRVHGDALLAAARSELADIEGVSVLVGVGDLVSSLDGLPGSAAHARLAAQMGEAVPELGAVVEWSELGVMRLLGELVGARDPETLLPPPLRRLLDEPDGSVLVATLEAYLEHGGDVAEAAAELFLHRSSLYNRLHRIEELAGVDIRSGADRLELHLGIRLWRMSDASRARH